MKFYLISDNMDTLVGMRLAGIEGVRVGENDDVREILSRAIEDPEIGIILMTEGMVSLCADLVDDLKLRRAQPLIVEIPDRHGGGRTKDSILRYIREAIGLKI